MHGVIKIIHMGAHTLRSEVTKNVYPIYSWWPYLNSYPTAPPNEGRSTQTYSQDLVESYGNASYRDKTRKSKPVGGNFHVIKRDYRFSDTLSGRRDFGSFADPFEGKRHMVARQFAKYGSFTNKEFPTVKPSSDAILMAFGRKAIAAVNPLKSSFDGATFLGELREGLPSVIGFANTGKQRASLANKAGSEYLNVEFGWKPLLSDFRKFTRTMQNADRLLAQYRKAAGKLLNRRYELEPEVTVKIENKGRSQVSPLLQSQLYSDNKGYGNLTVTTKTERYVWFEGVFQYYIPESGLGKNLAEANKLYGIKPDPAMLWELAPWSWAVDWVSDAGTLMENLSSFALDSLVMPWLSLIHI